MIQIENVTKRYGSTIALQDVSLTIEPGVFGLLGPNGAGKTTLMNCLLGLLSYRGTIRFGEGKLPLIGYLPQNLEIFDALTVREVLEYLSILKGIPKNDAQIDELIEQVNLTKQRQTKSKALSGGMRRRLGIAQALLGKPEWVLIDEPTAGLDPAERVRFRNMIKCIAVGQNVIISSHIVEDIDILATHIAILDEGEVKMAGEKDALLEAAKDKVGVVRLTERELDQLEGVSYSIESQEGALLTARVVGEGVPADAEAKPPTVQDLYFMATAQER